MSCTTTIQPYNITIIQSLVILYIINWYLTYTPYLCYTKNKKFKKEFIMLSLKNATELSDAIMENNLELTLDLIIKFRLKVQVKSFPAYPVYFCVAGKLTKVGMIRDKLYYQVRSNAIDCQFPFYSIRGEAKDIIFLQNKKGVADTAIIWVNHP